MYELPFIKKGERRNSIRENSRRLVHWIGSFYGQFMNPNHILVMRTKKSVRYFTHLPVLIGLSFLWISCNQSSTGEAAATTTATDTSIIGTLEMRPPGSIIPRDSAIAWIKAYRKAGGGPFSTNAIVHHPDAVKYYMDSIFYKYTPLVQLPKGYVWRVAFSPMFYRQPGGPKLSFCVVPCIVNEGVFPNEVFEYFKEMEGNTDIYKNYYLPLFNSVPAFMMKGMNNDSIPDGFIFDEGQLWP